MTGSAGDIDKKFGKKFGNVNEIPTGDTTLAKSELRT